MMQRLYSLTKPIWMRFPKTYISNTVTAFKSAVVDIFPFLDVPPPPLSAPNYRVRGDHCFLPEHRVARFHWHIETISLVAISASLLVIFLWMLSSIFMQTLLVVVSGLIVLFYALLIVFKVYVVLLAAKHPFIEISKRELARFDEANAPTITVLVPLRDEAEVMEQIVGAMSSLEYPSNKLELLITVEEYDHSTRKAIERVGIPDNWKVVVLPDTQPKTKPKALNVAFLQTTGEYLVIYDAEIMPDSDQLKKAMIAFKKHPEYTVMLTRLDHYNADQNLLTKLFNMEFTFHYDMYLPGLQKLNAPIALSGHSTFFRRDALIAAGAWDPYNVAEDCEVGIRLFRMGYKAGVLNSFAKEEAASSISSWVKQRTRWLKGFLQTAIVHLRFPVALYRDLGGMKHFCIFIATVPGTVILNILNWFSWIILVWWLIARPAFVQTLYPQPMLYVAGATFLLGGFLFIYLNAVALFKRGKFHIVKWWLLTPLYWILLSYAAMRALWHLLFKPHIWEKTVHGTHLS